jgi:DNA repair protein SbcD/Mre11
VKFLHIADVHLGCTRYQLAESPRDFFEAWIDVLRRYAIAEQVDFVLMCGDFFHKRSVPPETMDYAVEGLGKMRAAGIPIVCIEGNHDQRHTDSQFSWLRSLSKWGLLKLLEPTRVVNPTTSKLPSVTLSYEPWDDTSKTGGYIDIGRARIFGSEWYGASGNWAIPMLTRAIADNRRADGFHILMLHTDVEGHQVHPIPALSLDALRELRSAVEYLGLGHTHRHYEIDNWAFNPGSIEITNISEFRETRGVFIVEVDDENRVTSRHETEYHHRPFQQLGVDVTGTKQANEITSSVLELVEREGLRAEAGKPAPIVEIALRGQLGFPNSQLELIRMRDQARALTGALHVRIKNHTVPLEHSEAVEPTDDAGRALIEKRVIDDLVLRDSRYKDRYSTIADAVVGAKRMVLNDEPSDKIADFIAVTACPKD